MNIIQNPSEHWAKVAQAALVGRTIVGARYLTNEEAGRLGWRERSVVFELDNGHLVWPSMDDEGNGAGALFTTYPESDTLPVLGAA